MSLPRMSELFITFFPIFAHHRAIPSLTLTSSAFKDALSATEENPDDCTLCFLEGECEIFFEFKSEASNVLFYAAVSSLLLEFLFIYRV